MLSDAVQARDAHLRYWWHQRSPLVLLAGFVVLLAGCSAGGGGRSPAPAGTCGGGTEASSATGSAAAGGYLMLHYRPSQVTGWSAPYSRTIGGHVAAKNFACGGRAYRVSLLSFGQSGNAPNPVFENVPADPVIKFRHTLARSWGKYYSFRYQGGLPSGARFAVESYSVKVSAHSGGVSFGSDLYLVYLPGRQPHLPIDSDLQFIQVVWSHGPSFVDGTTANPFYGSGSGLTSIHGNQSVSVYDNPTMSRGASSHVPRTVFRAEVFLAQDTGTRNAAGKDIIDIFGGVKWGWQTRSLPSSR
jgi:hypothetical protein